MSPEQTGLITCVGITLFPLMIGLFVGYRFRGRVDNYGFWRAFLPGFLRRYL